MKKLFSLDNPLMKGLSVAADLLILNLLTVLMCIPVVTIGPAVTAMNDIVIHIVRGEEGYIIGPYFQSFRVNFKKSLLMTLVVVLVFGILYLEYLVIMAYMPDMKVVVLALGVIALAVVFYAFGMHARYENTMRATWKNAAILSVGYFPRTAFMVVCAVGMWLLCIQFYQFGIPILLLFGLALPCYVNILLLNGVFRKLEGEEEKTKKAD